MNDKIKDKLGVVTKRLTSVVRILSASPFDNTNLLPY